MTTTLYEVLSHLPARARGNAPDLSIYRAGGQPEYSAFPFKAPAEGRVLVDLPHGSMQTV